jgi:hypothetical protein
VTAGREPPAEAGARYSGKGGGLLREGSGLRYPFIDQAKKAYSVERLCRALGVSRAGYYAFVRRPQRGPDSMRQTKRDAVRQLAAESDHV